MITINLTESQAKLVEDALAMLAVTYPRNNEACFETHSIVINARHGLIVKRMMSENSEAGAGWLNDKETA